MRQRSKSVSTRNKPVLESIHQLKSEHPFWGYRRIWAHLRYVDGVIVNKKRVLRLMKEHNLIVTLDTRLKAKRISDKRKPKPIRPHSWWGIDMTKVMLDGFGWPIITLLHWYVYAGIVRQFSLNCQSDLPVN